MVFINTAVVVLSFTDLSSQACNLPGERPDSGLVSVCPTVCPQRLFGVKSSDCIPAFYLKCHFTIIIMDVRLL